MTAGSSQRVGSSISGDIDFADQDSRPNRHRDRDDFEVDTSEF